MFTPMSTTANIYRYLLCAATFALAPGYLSASSVALPQNDTIVYLTQRDSVMLEIAPDRRKYTRHVFTPRQTVYSLSRFYAQDIDQVYALNPALADATPGIGDTVRVAVPNVAITRFRDSGFVPERYAPVCYRVGSGETMYHIAKTVFRMPVDTLLALNSLSTSALSVGQVLQVGWMDLAGAADHIKPQALSPLQRVNQRNALEYKARVTPADRRELVRGVATYTPGSGDASGKLFALYSGAAAGSYLRIGNTANDRVAYVEVIGRLPQGVRHEDVDVVISGTAARVLGAGAGKPLRDDSVAAGGIPSAGADVVGAYAVPRERPHYDREHAPHQAPQGDQRGDGHGVGEGRDLQPRAQHQGPHGPQDARGRRGQWRSQARRHHYRVYLGQYRHGTRARGGGQGLPLHLHHER